MTRTTILFLHSAGPQSATEGSGPLLARLRAELPEALIAAPALPTPEDPDPAAWEEAVRAEIAGPEGPVAVVGHSLGGSVALRVLAQGDPTSAAAVRGVVTIAAPCWDAGDPDWPVVGFGLPPDIAGALARLEVLLLHGTADEVVPPGHADRLRSRLPSPRVRRIEGMDHAAAAHADRIAAVLRPLLDARDERRPADADASRTEGGAVPGGTDSWLSETRSAYDIDASGYAEQVRGLLAETPHLAAQLTLFAELLRRDGGGPVADVGCGTGYVTAHLRKSGVDAFGIDLSPEMIALARRDHPAARFEVGTMTELDLEDRSLAGIVAFWSVIHVPDHALPGVLDEFVRVLRPGGLLLVGFHVGDGVHHSSTGYTGRAITVDSYRRRPETVTGLLRKAGFTIDSEVLLRPDDEVPGAVVLARGPV
ncbi:alpha/beta fold hydrolase [Brachybacterium sp. P6-10-X1]|uniref:alpha/beta fold hydrolase n=1 Tax=Brachybacterium sp. P6-10-X1 TaxID=1903186 RepID=UPI0012F7A5A9|nr:alpha/beta fold hydrolase [Brachybacterium sp. P6-10-X1]